MHFFFRGLGAFYKDAAGHIGDGEILEIEYVACGVVAEGPGAGAVALGPEAESFAHMGHFRGVGWSRELQGVKVHHVVAV